ncbi:VWA domain-containing protein [Erwinia billingiae]|uniref:VWA domain-containing protein n=1 Tax=Erwinia billingiae TaxID=182337 RepID=UPI00320B8C32
MSELLTHIDFAWPLAWILLLLPLLMRFLPTKERQQEEKVRVPFLPALAEELKLHTPPAKIRWPTQLVFWLVWTLLVCALARPEYLMPPQQIIKPMRNMVLILDVSGSMEKNDAQDGMTRLQALQRSVRAFVAQRKTDRIGLVIFASSAWPFAPISEDKQALLSRINQLAPGMIGQQTAIGDALGVAVKLLDSSLDRDASKLAILLTDGNETASQLSPALAAQLAATHHVQVHTIAFGDINSSGEDKVDTALLKQIAQLTGGEALQANTSADALDNVWQQIDAMTPAQVKTTGFSWHLPLFHWPLMLAMFLLLAFTVLRLIRERRS